MNKYDMCQNKNNKITSYFVSIKNKIYGYDASSDTYYCIECGKKLIRMSPDVIKIIVIANLYLGFRI